MVKRFFLSIADSATLGGCAIPVIIGVVGGFVLFLFNRPAGFGVMILAFVLALFMSIVSTVVRVKYITHVSDYDYGYSSLRGPNYLLQIANGQVVGVADRFWGKANIFPIRIPWVYEGKFEANTKISCPVKDTTISIGANLVFHVPDKKQNETEGKLPNGFDPAELYGNMAKSKLSDVAVWLATNFKEFAESNSAVQQAFVEHAEDQPYFLMSAVRKALESAPYKCPLKNITGVEVKVTHAPGYFAKVAYK